jgi:hypothetical protein
MTDQLAAQPATTDAPATPVVETQTAAPVEPGTPAPAEPVADVKNDAIADPVKVDAPKAPEKYEFAAPEGQQFNSDVLGEFEATARELDLSQEAAQTLLSKVAPAIQKAQQAEAVRMQNEWAEAARSDKEFGGDKLAENLAVANKALTTFGTPELKTLLDQTGLANHPEIIRAFYKAGKQISSSTFVTGGLAQSNDATPTAKKLYPDMN